MNFIKDIESAMKMGLDLNEFDYELPENKIAIKLASPRDSAKLLILPKENDIEHRIFKDVVDYLSPGDVLVLNKTKVSKAKLLGEKSTGSPAEIVLEKRINLLEYLCKIKTRHPIVGTKILFKHGNAVIIGTDGESFIVRFSSPRPIKDGILPTPPYINRKIDDEEYQTVYAETEGSLAAPTAGLHFTDDLIKSMIAKGIKIVYITLHVSYGTFKSIDYGIDKYIMEPEYYEITEEDAAAINTRKGRLVVVGTTSLKALESSCENGKIHAKKENSQLFIYPPYKFGSGTDILITNFHLPKSTLLLLTCAFGGRDRIMKAYEDAIKNDYKFYSLGDAMMIYK